MSNNTRKRFVSLHGFFAFEHPAAWVNETDEAGHYIFFDQDGGQGVLRIMIMPNEFEGEDAGKFMLDEVFKQNREFGPELLATGQNRFVYFVKEHEVNRASFTVYYWATAKADKVVLFTYTVQTDMKTLPKAENEKAEIEAMIGSYEWMQEQ
jgi:hypothetical protein